MADKKSDRNSDKNSDRNSDLNTDINTGIDTDNSTDSKNINGSTENHMSNGYVGGDRARSSADHQFHRNNSDSHNHSAR